jgi:hypothetical protein
MAFAAFTMPDYMFDPEDLCFLGDCDVTANTRICPCGCIVKPGAHVCGGCGWHFSDDATSFCRTLNAGSQPASAAAANNLDNVTHVDNQNPTRQASMWSGATRSESSVAFTSDACVDQNEITTLKICNVPCRHNAGKVRRDINNFGFENTYDLLYMPLSKGRQARTAFVNFKKPEFATAFAQAFKDFRFPDVKWDKLGYTAPARVQGYKAHIDLHTSKPNANILLLFA